MTKEAHLFDGTILTFPDETPDDVMDRSVQQEMAMRRRQTGTAPEDRRGPSGVPGTSTEPVPAQDQLPVPVAPQPAPEEPGLVGRILGDVGIGGQSIVEAGLNLLGAPTDLMNNLPRVANVLPGVSGVGRMSDIPGGHKAGEGPAPFMGGELLNKGWNAIVDALDKGVGGPGYQGVPPDDQLTWDQRIAHRVGNEIGAATIPALGAVAKAYEVGGPAARATVSSLTPETTLQSIVQAPKRIGAQMVESAAASPSKFLKNEVIASGAAGAAAGAANQFVDPHTKTGSVVDLLAALTGVGTVAGTRSLFGAGKNVFDAFRGGTDFVDDVVKKAVTDRIVSHAELPIGPGGVANTDQLVDAITRAPKISDTVPGVQESLADVTKNPGLAALEYSRQSGENSGLFTRKSNQNAEAIASAIEGQSPQATPGAFRSELETARQEQLSARALATQQAQDAVTQASRTLSSTMTAGARGNEIRTALENASEEAQAIVREAFRPLNETTHLLDPQPLAEQFDTLGQSLSVAERRRFRPGEADVPGQLSGDQTPVDTGLVDASGRPITRTPEPTLSNLREFTGIRTALTDAKREALTNGQVNHARIIQDHINALDTYLEANMPASLRAQYDAARGARLDYGNRFERPQSGIAQTLRRNQGRPQASDDTITGKFYQSDEQNLDNFRALMRESGTDPGVRNAIRDQVLHDVQSRGYLNDPQALDAYLGRYSTLFDSFPQLRSELGNAASLRRTLDTAQSAEAATQRSLGTPGGPGQPPVKGTSPTAKYLEYGEENSKRAMSNVLGQKDPVAAMDELLNQVKNQPGAVEGAKKAFWNLMEEKTRSTGVSTRSTSGEQPWRTVALKNFLDDPVNAKVLERLYRDDPTHLDNLKEIVNAVQGLETRVGAKAKNTSGTAQSILPSAEAVQSRITNIKRKVVGVGYTVTAVGASIMRKLVGSRREAAINRMLDDALLNPQVAKALLAENNPANRAALARWTKGWVGAEGVNILDETDDSSGDETKDAIMRRSAGGPR